MLDATSSTPGGEKPQEPPVQVAPATTAPPASESLQPPAEEQKVTTPPEFTPEQIATLLETEQGQAAVYRAGQSMKDKELQQERLKRQQQEEARRREAMDDEEYGSYTRAEEKRQQTLQQGVAHTLGRMIDQMKEQAASVITNKAQRESMIAKSSSFESFPEYVRACAKAEVQHQLGLKMTKREKELTESLTEKIRADQVDQLYPQLGSGLASVPHADLHGEQAIGAGIAAEMAKQRKEG